ncbi:MAG: hypothetical protein GXP27_12820 [Planctomycetes bacterium]|nr:hypothetical protein [Planctomycetota bacterium]
MRYVAKNGTVLDPERSERKWDEGTRWDGRNHISLATASQWEHEVLHLGRSGVWWIEHWSQWQGSTPSGRVVSARDACRWLLANDYDPDGEDFPDELAEFVDQLIA